MLAQQPHGLLVRAVGEIRLLLVAHPLRRLRERVVVGAQRARGDRVGHAPLEHHRAGDLRHLLEIVGGAVRHPAEHDLFGGATGKRDDHAVDQLLLRVEVAVFLGQVERVAERVTARDDGHLLQLHHRAHEVRHECVTALVVGEDAPLLLGQHLALLQAGDDPLERPVEVLLCDRQVAATAGLDRRLVADVRELGARQARSLPRNGSQIDVVEVERLAPGVDAEDRLAAREVGRRHEELTVEAARAAAAPGRDPGSGSRRPSPQPALRPRSRRARRAAG